MLCYSTRRRLETGLECPFPVFFSSLRRLLRFPLHHPDSPLPISSAAHQILLPPASSDHSTSREAATVPSPRVRAPLSMRRPVPTLPLPPIAIPATMRVRAGPPGGNGSIYRLRGGKAPHDDLERRSKKIETLCPSDTYRRWVWRHGIEPVEQI